MILIAFCRFKLQRDRKPKRAGNHRNWAIPIETLSKSGNEILWILKSTYVFHSQIYSQSRAKAGLTLLPTSVHNSVANSKGVSANSKGVSIAVNIGGHGVSDHLENSCWIHCCEHVLAVL